MTFLDLDRYNKERARLVNEEGISWIDACSKAWKSTMGVDKK